MNRASLCRTVLSDLMREITPGKEYISIKAGADPFWPAEAIDYYATKGLAVKNACTIALLRFKKRKAGR